MSANIVNQVAYIRTSREFPEEAKDLSVELTRTYVDIATCINSRTIGLFPKNRPAITGESWFLTGTKQQSLRQIYTFTGAGTIPHGIDFNSVFMFSKPSGSYSDGTNYYGAIYATSVAIAGQVSFWIDPTNINVIVDAGSPAVSNGLIILEFLSKVRD